MRIAVIHAVDGTDVRVHKLCRSMIRLGHEVHFIGWDRRPRAKKTLALDETRLHILVLETRHGKFSAGGFRRFLGFIYAAVRRIDPQVLWVVNEDLAAFLLPLRAMGRRGLVLDIFDALADRHSHRSAGLRLGIRGVSRLARARADVLVATDEARGARMRQYRDKLVVIANYPEDPGEALARTLPTGPIQIWAGGSLNRIRGLEQLLAAIEGLHSVRIHSAGWSYDSCAEAFLKHPSVEFHGILTPKDSLAAAARCDAVFAYYQPVSVNYRMASPNKVYDALSIGRPTIINSEVGIARFVADNDVGFVCPYDDIEALRRIIAGLGEQRQRLPMFAERARALFRERYTWAAMEPRIRDTLARFGRG